jgi:hypothetical protein
MPKEIIESMHLPEPNAVWREGDRIRDVAGAGYGDRVSDAIIREHIAEHRASDGDSRFIEFAEAVLRFRSTERDHITTQGLLPHSRACDWRKHEHGPACHSNCPTCSGRPFKVPTEGAPCHR